MADSRAVSAIRTCGLDSYSHETSLLFPNNHKAFGSQIQNNGLDVEKSASHEL